MKSIIWWAGFCILPQICYSSILVSWNASLISPGRCLSLVLKVPALVIGPAITPFTFATIKTEKELVEPDHQEKIFKRSIKTRLRPKISLLHSMINFVVTLILASIVVFWKAGEYTRWLSLGVTILVLCPILAIPFYLILNILEQRSEMLNKKCFQHDKKNCSICDGKYSFTHLQMNIESECKLHESHYPCKICNAIQNMECSGPETEWRPARQKIYECFTCKIDQICQTCKRVCHQEHELKFKGSSTFVCNCNQKNGCSLFYCKKHPNLQLKCIACNFKGGSFCSRKTAKTDGDVRKDFYTCFDCKMIANICKTCRYQCHKRHNTKFAGKAKKNCVCGNKNTKSANTCIFVCPENPQHPFITEPSKECNICLVLNDCFQNSTCTFLVTGDKKLDNNAHQYECQFCSYEVVCKTCKKYCHKHEEAEETHIDMEEDEEEVETKFMARRQTFDAYSYGYASFWDDMIPNHGFFCQCGAGRLSDPCQAPNEFRDDIYLEEDIYLEYGEFEYEEEYEENDPQENIYYEEGNQEEDNKYSKNKDNEDNYEESVYHYDESISSAHESAEESNDHYG